jgi:cellulose synthase/poly-beta-1,6-N-acetylglucosamine synthase-like glycosyltransferase
LSYSQERLEVIVVDDGSTDRTAEIIRDHASRFSALRGIAAGSQHGKVNALAAGVEASTGEILLFTDADCRVPERWVQETVRWYSDERVGLVAGFTHLEGTSLFARVQALDWCVLFSIAAAAVRLRLPITAVGNNLSVRRSAYLATGGYRNIPFSVTEDFALFRAVLAAGWDVRFPLERGALVESAPCATVREVFSQKKRWFLGGVGMQGVRRLLFVLGYAFTAMLVVAACTGNLTGAALGLLLKTGADAALVSPAVRMFGRRSLFALLPLYEVYSLAITLFFPPLVLLHPRVTWKDRTVRNARAPRGTGGSC